MVRENGGTNSTWRNLVSGRKAGRDGERGNLQALHHTEWSQTKVGTEHREESVEKCHRPPNLREDEGNDLEDDQEQIENGPKLASGFVRDRAVAERKKVSLLATHGREEWNLRDVVTVE
jgi:hypothetical protein